jgi:hypothetical protein
MCADYAWVDQLHDPSEVSTSRQRPRQLDAQSKRSGAAVSRPSLSIVDAVCSGCGHIRAPIRQDVKNLKAVERMVGCDPLPSPGCVIADGILGYKRLNG